MSTHESAQGAQAVTPGPVASESLPASGKRDRGVPDTQLRGPLLLAARAMWLAFSTLAMGRFVAAIPAQQREVRTLCAAPSCPEGALTAVDVTALRDLGLSLGFFAAYQTALSVMIAAAFCLVAVLIFIRKSNDWMGLFASAALMSFGATFPSVRDVLRTISPGGGVAFSFYSILGGASFLLLFYFLFPDGRFLPRWTMFAAPIWLLVSLYSTLWPDAPGSMAIWPARTQIAWLLAWTATGVFAAWFRYRRGATRTQRLQMKWIIYGSTIAFSGAALFVSLLLIFPALGTHGHNLVLYLFGGGLLRFFAVLMVPISFGISILRHRLWHIDLIINRTLVYVPLTGIVAGVYTASVTMFQRVFMAVTGEASDAAIVLTTLVLASTFTPIKNGLQAFVDRRFKETPDPAAELKRLDRQVQSVIEVIDVGMLSGLLLDSSMKALKAPAGAVYLWRNGELKMVRSKGSLNGESKIKVALESGGKELGVLALRTPGSEKDYPRHEIAVLRQTASRIAQAIDLLETAAPEPPVAHHQG